MNTTRENSPGNAARIRFATPADAAALAAIYAPYVRETAISFEYEPPSPDVFAARIAATHETHPWLVCDMGGIPCGYAYASPHKDRAAYQYDVEVSAYVDQNAHSRRIGSSLYGALFELLAMAGFYNAFAGITLPNKKSLALHRSAGFAEVGVFHRTGYKFGAWHDVLWMEKRLQPLSMEPAAPLPVRELPASETERIFTAHAAAIPRICQP